MHRTNGTGNVAGLFTGGPPATCLTPEFLNSIQEEICNVIESAGLTVATDGYSDTKTQLLTAIRTLIPKSTPYDVIVSTQTEFNAIITRIGANHYHIADAYKTVLIKNLSGGYQCSGVTSFLSGGDTWGYLQTNLCTHLKFENGAYLDVQDTAFYLDANTNDCKLENVYIKGLGTVAAALTRSFYASGLRMTFDNCKTSNRYASASFNGFEGTNVTATDITNKYIGCNAFSISNNTAGVVISGFKYCYNISNGTVYLFTSSAGSIRGFYTCNNLSGCISYNNNITVASAGAVYGFHSCTTLSCCYAYLLNSDDGNAIGFDTCYMLSSCYANAIDAPTAGKSAAGFVACLYLSACQANDIDSTAGSASGFSSCGYGSSLYTSEAANAGNDWMNTNDAQITNKYSCPAVWT